MTAIQAGTRLTGAGPYVLGSRRFQGGEGIIFDVENKRDHFVKVFTRPFDGRRHGKLEALRRARTTDLAAVAALPVDIVGTGGPGTECGIVIPVVADALPLHAYTSPRDRLANHPEASLATLAGIATDLARAVAKCHAAGIVIGDLSPTNVLVRRNGSVCLIDCDSFQINGYPCEVATEEMLAPELQGVTLANTLRTPHHDTFALAILLFQLLCLGRHPFAGNGELSIRDATAQSLHALARTRAAAGFAITGLTPEDILSPKLVRLFRRAFDRTWSRLRPTATEWRGALQAFAKRLVTCKRCTTHAFDKDLQACPWCDLEREAGRVAFFKTIAPAPTPKIPHWQQGAKRVPALWMPRLPRMPAPLRRAKQSPVLVLTGLLMAFLYMQSGNRNPPTPRVNPPSPPPVVIEKRKPSSARKMPDKSGWTTTVRKAGPIKETGADTSAAQRRRKPGIGSSETIRRDRSSDRARPGFIPWAPPRHPN